MQSCTIARLLVQRVFMQERMNDNRATQAEPYSSLASLSMFAVQLHVEMQQSMQQLSAIQSELRGNINFMNPG